MFEFDEELSMFWKVRNIDEEAGKIILIIVPWCSHEPLTT